MGVVQIKIGGEFNFILHVSDKQGGNSARSFPPKFVNDKLLDMNMHEVVSFGNPYTWCNIRFKNPNKLILEKLDKDFINDKRVTVLPQTRATNLGRIFSDHSPVLVQCFHWVRNLNIPYKFFKCWQLNPEFKEVLNESWSKRVVGSPTFVVVNKLKHVKFDLSKWNINSFGHIKTTIGRLNSELERLQALPYSPQIGQYILNYSKQLDYWYEIEHCFYKQKSMINYFTQYDRNTNFFHNSVNLRNMYNTIHTIRDDQALKYVTPIISDEVNSSLIAIPTYQEIRDTVNSLASWSSPGPDGFQAGFFQDNWDIVQVESAFVANHQIHDNVVITHEILHSFKRKKKSSKNGYLAIKLDLSKAFDRLEWSFILAVFKKLGFSDEWCQMISQCICTVSYYVLVNGSPSDPFYPSHGIRQGDCLLPYIFILCMEVLSQLLVKAEDEKLIQGFRFKKNIPSISHLFFADDCMLFCKASVSYTKSLLKIIDTFAQASGQAIDFENSGFITSKKMHHKHIKILAKILKMKFLSNSERYLGSPLFVGKDKTNSFNFLIENLYSRLSNTKKTNLNVAGRTVVTKHVLSSLAVYHMACFPLSKTITSKIDSIQRTFWWSKKNPKRAVYFSSWGDIGISKLNGGLCIRNTYVMNHVFISKLGWRIMKNPNFLISRFMKDKYFPNQNLLEIDKAASSSSWIWKGIVNGVQFIKANSVIKINDGVSSHIWSSNWIPGNLHPLVPRKSSHSDFVFVNELFDIQNGSWNDSLLSSLFTTEDVTRIKTIRLNLLHNDSLMWAHTSNGKFTIKSAYKVYMNDYSPPDGSTFWKKVWAIDFDDLCPLCKRYEDNTYIFIDCEVVKHIWFGLSLQHLINLDLDWIDDYFLFWHDSALGASPFTVSWPSIGGIVLWCVWKIRCEVIFKNASLDLNKIILDIKRMINTYISPRSPSFAPPFVVIKIPSTNVDHFMFIDGSFTDYNTGLSVIWCDTAGNVRRCRSDYGLMSDAVGAEAAALILAIPWAEEMHLTRVVFVIDCFSLCSSVMVPTQILLGEVVTLLSIVGV
ncbi:uncharacterized protein LOC113312696 [Papaver somniferum]|uniref:uncharacterized protein LOC113312696 n=1 Tax=Papaver somniferum TaxID=3469 RepID=UPI000E7000EE|nr:uncharacterized protein LOC113312696 [Papaver somniferum]